MFRAAKLFSQNVRLFLTEPARPKFLGIPTTCPNGQRESAWLS